MATAKWNTPSAVGSNIAASTLNGITNGNTSAVVTHDNSSNLDLYASVRLNLGSFNATATIPSVTLRVFSAQSSTVPDVTGIALTSGGDQYTVPITSGTSAKVVVFPMIRLYPESMRLAITNNSGGTFAGSANELYVRPYNENVT